VKHRPRALVIANRLPYPIDDGWKRRTFHLLKALSARYRVTLVSFHAGGEESAASLVAALGDSVDVQTVRPFVLAGPVSLGMGLVTSRPFHVWRLQSLAMRRLIARLAQQEHFDVAVATLIHLHPYLRLFTERTLRVVDTHNIDSLVLRRYAGRMHGPVAWYAELSAGKLERHEARVFGEADLVWVCSDEERERLARSVPGACVEVVANGVDTQAFAPSPDVSVTPGRLIFFGRLDYFPNADAVSYFATEILPLVRKRVPDAELVVAGPGAGRDLRALAETLPGLRILGSVPDLRPMIASAAVVVVPLRSGGGTRLKILEALALAKPVVSTTVGAEGLVLERGRDILIADEPQAFARAVVELLQAPQQAERIGHGGRAFVREHHDWRIIEERLLANLAAATSASPREATGTAA
jgi:sugar transferase (PEP-CTERM/EpsH1 system associated)